MPEAVVMAEPAYRKKQKLSAQEEAPRTELLQDGSQAMAGTDAPRDGYVLARVLPNGHGQIHTGRLNAKGEPVRPPKIDFDSAHVLRELVRIRQLRSARENNLQPSDGRYQKMTADEHHRAYNAVLAQARAQCGMCYARGETIELPHASAYDLEDKGWVEIL